MSCRKPVDRVGAIYTELCHDHRTGNFPSPFRGNFTDEMNSKGYRQEISSGKFPIEERSWT